MFKRFAIRSLAVLASLLALAPAYAAELPVKGLGDSGITIYPIKIPITASVNDFTARIPSCENMTVYWERGNSAQVTLYPADSDDTTAGLIDDNTPIKVFTTSERYGPFTPTKAYVSFVVNTVNASVPSMAKVTCSNFAGSGGVIGTGTYAEMTAATWASVGDQWVLTDDNAAGAACDAGDTPATADLWCGWNGSSWVAVGIAGGGIAQVSDDASPTLGGALDSGGFAIQNAASVSTKRLDGGVWFASQYASGSDSGGIIEAIAACAAGGGGVVQLPHGQVDIDGLAIVPAELFNLPVDGVEYEANCDVVGYGAAKASEGGVEGDFGTFIRITNTSGKTGFRVNGSGQRLEDFTLQMLNTDATTIGIDIASETTRPGAFCDGACAKGEAGTSEVSIRNVNVLGPAPAIPGSSSAGGPGIGIQLAGVLKSHFELGEIHYWDKGIHYDEPADNTPVISSNANTWSRITIRKNDIGISLDEPYTCTSISLIGATLEGNYYGLRAEAAMTGGNSECTLSDFASHWENFQTNLYMQSTQFSVAMFHSSFSLSGSGIYDLIRDTANAHLLPDLFYGYTGVYGPYYTAGEARFDGGIWNGVTALTGGSAFSGDLAVHATNCPEIYGTRSQYQSKLARGDACFEVDSNLLYICDPAAPDGQCDSPGDWTALGGDPVSIDGTPVTDALGANFQSSDSILLTNLGGSPDVINFGFSYLSAGDDPVVPLTELKLASDCTSGGLFTEGSTANTFEYNICLPPFGETVDVSYTLVLTSLAQTLTNKTLTSPTLTTPALGTPSALVLNDSNTTGSLDLAGGTIQGGVKVTVDAAATIGTLTTAGTNGDYYLVTTAGTITLPAITQSGLSACFQTLAAIALVIDSNASDGIRLPGASSPDTDGDSVDPTTPTAGDLICFLSRDNGTSDEWVASGVRGDWAAN